MIVSCSSLVFFFGVFFFSGMPNIWPMPHRIIRYWYFTKHTSSDNTQTIFVHHQCLQNQYLFYLTKQSIAQYNNSYLILSTTSIFYHVKWMQFWFSRHIEKYFTQPIVTEQFAHISEPYKYLFVRLLSSISSNRFHNWAIHIFQLVSRGSQPMSNTHLALS